MKKTKHILSIFLSLCIIVSCMTGLSVAASAWKNVTHVTSANLILLELQRSARQNSGKAKITINVPYGSTNAMAYEIPAEYQDAIFSYPDAFRAGSMGPDFYPDILTGQGYIHPYEKDKGVTSGRWISVLCDSVNMLPKGSEERKEALSFTLGFMLHYCGDVFGHDFINSFAGGTYPSLTEVGVLDGSDDNLNILLSHSSEETYVDGQANWDFYKNAGYLDIAAPLRFVTETLIYDGNVNNGAAKIFEEYGSITVMYRYLVNLRMRLYNKAEEWRSRIDLPTAALVKYLDAWIDDLDKATYALVGCFDKMANRMVSESSDPGLTKIVAEEIWAWADNYGKYVTPIPDIVIDGLGISDAFSELGTTIIKEIGMQYLVEDLKTWINEQIEELAKSVLGLVGLSDMISDYQDRVHDPSIQLDHNDNPFMASNRGSNFSDFDKMVRRFTEEQSLLDGKDIGSILDGTDGGTLDKLLDSGFEPFYNTMVMFKLILMGPDNYTDFIKTLSGVTQDQFAKNTAYLVATGLDVDVSTADTEGAGTDSNIYVSVTDLNGEPIKKKLLDKSGYNDFERGCNDTYNVELGQSVRIDQINVKIVQESTGTAEPEWSCENITVTPKHAGIALTMPIGCGSKDMMTDGDTWDLAFHDRVDIVTQSFEDKEATKAEVQIHTADVIGAGTDASVYLDVYKSGSCVKSILLDKNGNSYNDFEQNSTDTYMCSLEHTLSSEHCTGIPVDTLDFKLRLETANTAGEEWTVGYVKITAYNNDQPLSKTKIISGDHVMSAGDTWDLGLSGSFLTDLYPPVVLSYTTDVDGGPASQVMSLDDSGQFREGTSILWSSEDVRSSVFFRIFKGFSPDIRINDSIEISPNEKFDMDILLEGRWNGILKSRRDQVRGSLPMPDVTGSAVVSFIDANGTAVASLDKSVSSGVIGLRDYSDADLVPGTYDVKVEFTASTTDQQYSDAAVTIENVLTVKVKPTYTVTFKVVNGSWNDGTTDDKTVELTGTDLTRYLQPTDIPAVGAMPADSTYKAGSWDITPTSSTGITDDTTFIYTYAEKQLNSPTVTLSYTTVEYDGTEKKPGVTVKVDGTELAETDYSVSYSNNVNAGTNAAVTVTAAGDNYAFTAVTRNFTIEQRAITITAADQTVTAGGSIAEGVDRVSVTSGSLADGQSISAVTLTASRTDEPTAAGTITPGAAVIMSGDTDVTANYNITYAAGTLTVTGHITTHDEFDNYTASQKAAADALGRTTDSETSKELISDAKAAIDALTYDEEKTLDENKALVDAIIEKLKTDLAAQRIEDDAEGEFALYKTEQKAAADALAVTGDSDKCKELITAAKAEIDALTYDSTKTFEQNKSAVDNVVSTLISELEKQRNEDKYEAYKTEFEAYKTSQRSFADTLTKDTGNASEKSIIDKAKSEITALEYDKSKSLADNKARIDAVIGQLRSDIDAYWSTVILTVRFDTKGGTEVAPVTVSYGKTVSAPTVTKAGYTFVCWTLDGEEYNFTEPVTKDITLTANWEAIKHIVTFFVNNEKHSEAEVEHGKRVVFPDITVSEGKKLFGWTLDKELTVGFISATPVTGDLVLYAEESDAASVLINGNKADSLEAALKDLSGKDAFIVLYEDQELKNLKFPKGDTAIFISGNGNALVFNGSASLAPKQKLVLDDLTVKAANANGKAQNITLTAAAGGLTLSDIVFDGKNVNINGAKGNITLGDIDSSKCAQLNVTGSKKTALDIEGEVDATKVTGFGTLNVNGTLTVGKTLTVNELYLADGAVLNIASGAAVTIKNGISGTGTIHLEKGFKPITINGKASGHIKITADGTLEDQLIFKSKLTDLNDVFDISAIVPAITDGEYEYGLYTKSGKVYLYTYKFVLDGTPYAVWTDAMKAITDLKAKDAIYTLELLGDIDLGSSFTLPAKGKYAGLTICGNSHTITFKNSSITLTADLTLREVTLEATAKKGCTVKLNKFKLDIDESVTLNNCKEK